MQANTINIDKLRFSITWAAWVTSLGVAISGVVFLSNIKSDAKAAVDLGSAVLMELKGIREDLANTKDKIHEHDKRLSSLEEERRRKYGSMHE